jgi:hypothetical protein
VPSTSTPVAPAHATLGAAAPAPAGAGSNAVEPGPGARNAAPQPTGVLRVRVLTRGALDPVSGAQLTVVAATAPDAPSPLATAAQPPAEQHPLHTIATDAAGVATIELPVGPVRVTVHEPSAAAETAIVTAQATVETVLLVAVPIRADVRVVDTAGFPVMTARILARPAGDSADPDSVCGATGSDGHWRGELPWGTHVVRACADGHASSVAAVLAPNDGDATLALRGAPARVAGTLFDGDGRVVPNAGMLLQAEGEGAVDACATTRTDAEGRYAFEHGAAGAHTLVAWHGERAARRFARRTLALTAGSAVVADVAFGTGASIDVVLQRADGTPWAGAHFAATAEQQPARGVRIAIVGTTDPRGRLHVAELPPGRYLLTAAVEQEELREFVELRAGAALAFHRVIGTDAWLEVQLRTASGEPLRGWTVRTNNVFAVSPERDALFPRHPAMCTGDDGVARFVDVPARPTWVTIARPDSTIPVVQREVALRERTTITLPPAALATRRVIGRLGLNAMAGTTAYGASLLPRTAPAPLLARGLDVAVAADGTFAFEAVPGGSYALAIDVRDANGNDRDRVAWRSGIEVAGDRNDALDVGAIPVACTDVAVALLRRDGAAIRAPRLLVRLDAGFPFQPWTQQRRDDRVELQACRPEPWRCSRSVMTAPPPWPRSPRRARRRRRSCSNTRRRCPSTARPRRR